jgi:hypothetical protein
MNIIAAANPKWADVEQTLIDLDVETTEFGVIPFTASANDTEAHGRALFAQAVAGDFGAITPRPPKPINQVRAEKLAQLERARKAAEVAQVTVQGKPFPATEEFQAKISRALNYIGRGKPLNLDGAWRDSNAQSVNMNTTLLGQLEDAITAQGVAAWAKYWTKFDAVMAAATVDDVNAVEW